MRRWDSEACDRRFDPVSGAKIIQLTSSAVLSINIYCEQPYCSPDGQRLAILRRAYAMPAGPSGLWVADLQRLKVTCIEREGVAGVFNAAWSGLIHYSTGDGKLKRLDLTTLDVQEIELPFEPSLLGRSASVSPDQRYIICRQILPGKNPSVGIKRVDLHEMKEELIYDEPEMVNPHMQFNPVHGRDILAQLNRGSELAEDGSTVRACDPKKGTTHFLIDADGSNRRSLPVGPPHTGGSTGHSAHIADTGRAAMTTTWDYDSWELDSRTPKGNLVMAGAEDEHPSVFEAPDFRFYHLCVSKCGRYFVADAHHGSLYDERGVLKSVGIVIGCFETGKYRTLVKDSMASGGGGEHNHCHPYLTADNRHVVFNSNPFYSPTQVFAAEVPDGFFDELE